MKSSQNQGVKTGTAESAEETLRVIARLPAPEGLADRVQTRLRNAPQGGRILAWPRSFSGGWSYGVVRGAAAAAIVCVVAGGGWRIYSHVQPVASARIIVMPTPARPSRGFSIGGSVHTPDPMRGPVTTHQVAPGIGATEPSQPVPSRKDDANQGKKQGKGRKAIAGQPATSPQ